jgi:hypothetical protein
MFHSVTPPRSLATASQRPSGLTSSPLGRPGAATNQRSGAGPNRPVHTVTVPSSSATAVTLPSPVVATARTGPDQNPGWISRTAAYRRYCCSSAAYASGAVPSWCQADCASCRAVSGSVSARRWASWPSATAAACRSWSVSSRLRVAATTARVVAASARTPTNTVTDRQRRTPRRSWRRLAVM